MVFFYNDYLYKKVELGERKRKTGGKREGKSSVKERRAVVERVEEERGGR